MGESKLERGDYMSLTLYIVRHGEAYSNLNDIITNDKESELTIRGKIQAAAAGNKIKEMKIDFDAVYSSPYKRAKETCMIALKTAHLNTKEVVFSPYLIERNYYRMMGKSILQNVDLLQDLETDHKELETYDCEKKRFRRFMKEVRKNYPNGNILIFTHGLFEQAISKLYTGERPELLGNGGIRIITVDKGHEGSA